MLLRPAAAVLAPPPRTDEELAAAAEEGKAEDPEDVESVLRREFSSALAREQLERRPSEKQANGNGSEANGATKPSSAAAAPSSPTPTPTGAADSSSTASAKDPSAFHLGSTAFHGRPEPSAATTKLLESLPTAPKSYMDMSLEEKQRAYAEARARILGVVEKGKKEKDSSGNSGGASKGNKDAKAGGSAKDSAASSSGKALAEARAHASNNGKAPLPSSEKVKSSVAAKVAAAAEQVSRESRRCSEECGGGRRGRQSGAGGEGEGGYDAREG